MNTISRFQRACSTFLTLVPWKGLSGVCPAARVGDSAAPAHCESHLADTRLPCTRHLLQLDITRRSADGRRCWLTIHLMCKWLKKSKTKWSFRNQFKSKFLHLDEEFKNVVYEPKLLREFLLQFLFQTFLQETRGTYNGCWLLFLL